MTQIWACKIIGKNLSYPKMGWKFWLFDPWIFQNQLLQYTTLYIPISRMSKKNKEGVSISFSYPPPPPPPTHTKLKKNNIHTRKKENFPNNYETELSHFYQPNISAPSEYFLVKDEQSNWVSPHFKTSKLLILPWPNKKNSRGVTAQEAKKGWGIMLVNNQTLVVFF